MGTKQTMSNKLKAIRSSRGASLEEFSTELGIARSTLQNIESGRANLTLDTVEQIAQNLNTDALTLLSDDISGMELHTAEILLQTISSFMALPKQDRLAAADMFIHLIRLLSTGTDN